MIDADSLRRALDDRNIIERLVIMTPGERIEARHLPPSLLGSAGGESGGSRGRTARSRS